LLFIWLTIAKCSFNRSLEKTKQMWNSIPRIEQSHHAITIKHNNQRIFIPVFWESWPGSLIRESWFLKLLLMVRLILITTVTRRHFLLGFLPFRFVLVEVMSSYSWVPPKLVGLFQGYLSRSWNAVPFVSSSFSDLTTYIIN